ncbi:MAG: hypothetical protein LBT40_15440 [Deltaproteobacteria bacterium]|jgi:hypothetical protein|nr:hypothetical protein [Deltaproteobacteria bacterium]
MDFYDVAMLFLLDILVFVNIFKIISRTIIIPRLEKNDAVEARAASRAMLSTDGLQQLQRGRKTGRSA